MAIDRMTLARHIELLAEETKTNPEAVHAITGDIAARLANRAKEADARVGSSGGENWLETVLACNAASNRHARAIIEHKARTHYNNGIAPALATATMDEARNLLNGGHVTGDDIRAWFPYWCEGKITYRMHDGKPCESINGGDGWRPIAWIVNA